MNQNQTERTDSFPARRARRAAEAAAVKAARNVQRQKDKSERDVAASREDLLSPAYRIAAAEAEIDRLDSVLAGLDRGPASLGKALAYGPLWAITLWGADAAMLGATTHMVAGNNFGVDLPLGAAAATSGFVALAEVLVSVGIAQARIAADDAVPGATVRLRTFLFLAIVMTLALACGAVAPFMVEDRLTGPAQYLIPAFVTGLALVVHTSTFVMGATIGEAWDRLRVTPGEARLYLRVATYERTITAARANVAPAVRSYTTALGHWELQYGAVPKHLLLTPRDMDLVNRALQGDTVLRAAGTDDNEPDAGLAGVAAPVAPVPSAPAGELDYLRTVLDGQLRDADGTLSTEGS